MTPLLWTLFPPPVGLVAVLVWLLRWLIGWLR
jgi:hypothetical protein